MARDTSHAKMKFEERIRNDISSFMRGQLSDPRFLNISITRVELSNDHSWAKVYWDTFDSDSKESIEKALGGTSKKVRGLLAKTLNVRHTPEIKFLYDSQYEDEHKIMNLLNKEDV